MARNPKIKKCKTCGTILPPKSKVGSIISDSDKALERYYNKHIRKKK